MDPDISVIHVVQPGKLKRQQSFILHLSSTFNRLNPPNDDSRLASPGTCNNPPPLSSSDNNTSSSCSHSHSDFIDMVWRKRTLENPKLYNDTKFRIHSICNHEEDKEKIQMCLGVTDYRDFLGTNWSSKVTELQIRGQTLHDNPQAFLSDPLGVGAFVLTKDQCVVFLRRSEFCAEAPCLWDIPGGHAEPKEIVGRIPLHQIDVSEMREEEVLKEIFHSIIREVTDEVNIPPDQLEEPLYMGTARNQTSGGRPSSEFLIRCHLTSHEVKRFYEEGNQSEADESTYIRVIPLHDINKMAKENRKDISDLWKNLAPSAKGCLILYWLSHQIL